MRILLALFLVLAQPLWAEEPPLLLVLGDSLSAGYGLGRGEGWVDLLESRLIEMGLPWRLVNASVSGETSLGGRNRLPALLRQHQPQRVIIELGGNDGLRGLPIPDLRANLAAMVEASRGAGAEVLLIGMRIPPNYGPLYTRLFYQSYRTTAENYKVPLVPFLLEGVGGVPQLMQEDGIHANDKAQSQLLENVWPALEPLLR